MFGLRHTSLTTQLLTYVFEVSDENQFWQIFLQEKPDQAYQMSIKVLYK